MAQRKRHAHPGTFHHVFNRGMGKRVVLATRADYRRFLTLLACVSREKLIEVHAYCLMATHFHLLVRIPKKTGDLSVAMMRLQNAYVRWFNRRNRRDGPLFRGRFGSKPVRSRAYWIVLLRCIDLNPVKAGLVDQAHRYAFSSARCYHQGVGPRWLERRHAARLMHVHHGQADPVVGYRTLMAAPRGDAEVERRRASDPHARIRWARVRTSQWPILHASLLHDLCGLSSEAIALRQDCAAGSASRRVRAHRQVISEDASYAATASEVGRAAFKGTYGCRWRGA